MPQTISAYDTDCPKTLGFGGALRKFRERRKWGVPKLELQTNKACTTSQIQRWEAGRALPTHVYHVEQLIEALRCNGIEKMCLIEHYFCDSLKQKGQECNDELRKLVRQL